MMEFICTLKNKLMSKQNRLEIETKGIVAREQEGKYIP